MVQSMYLFVIFTITFGYCSCCPKLQSKTFTTQDATIVTNIAYISEFTLDSDTGSTNLYAELNGNLVPVSVVGSNKYQVSWTELPKKVTSEEKIVKLFNEDGYTAYRKALRSGVDVSTVPPLFKVIIDHAKIYNGPLLKSEFVATVISILLAYFAVVSRSKVLS